jgi:lipoprotein-releasing system permease protein
MRFAWLIAVSHLRSRKKEMGVSAITLISIVGVTVGVAALIMVLSVMAGFEIDLRDKILGSNAHIVVLKYTGTVDGYEEAITKIEAVPDVKGVAPFVYSEMMIRSAAGATGVILKGIDPKRVGEVIDLADNLVQGPDGELTTREAKQAVLDRLHEPPPGPFDSENDPNAAPLPGIVIGEELANELKVFVGDKVYIINPVSQNIGPLGAPVPDVKQLRVAGIFYSGMYEYDTKWTYVSIPDAQQFLKLGDSVTGIEITVGDIFGVDATSLAIEKTLEFPFYSRHWKNLNKSLFSALKLEKVVMGLILGLIVAVASLNIAGTLILVVLSKGREIAIMKAMGATGQQIRGIFILEGLFIGLVGGSVGTVLGLLGCVGLDRYGWPLDTDVYYLDRLPVEIEPTMVALVGVVAVLICFLATLYPASRAAAIDPAEGLRYE